MKKFTLTFLSICFLFIFSPVFAVTVDISNCPASISDQSFECNFLIQGSTSDTNYLRIDLYKEGTTNYFGETFTGGSWYSGSDGKQYLAVSTTSGSIKGKIGNPSASEFPGSGNFKIKLRRYTSSGNRPSPDDQQTPKDIEINFQALTPTPTETQTPTPTTTNTPTPTATTTPTKTPTPIKRATATPTKSQSQQNTASPSGNPNLILPSSILGSSTSSASPTPSPTKTEEKEFSFLNLIFIAGGIVLILSGALVFTFIAKGKFKGI